LLDSLLQEIGIRLVVMGKNKNKKKGTESGKEDMSSNNVKSPVAIPETKQLGEKNLDEFMDDWDEDDEEEMEGEKEMSEGSSDEEESGEDEDGDADSDVEESDDKVVDKSKKLKTGAKSQKNYISSLKDKDPEFFEFLKENDEDLLNFDESSDEEEDTAKADGAHELPDKLEVASDESDFEDDDVEKSGEPSGSRRKLNQAQVTAWQEALGKQPNISLISDIVEGFRGAVAAIASPNKAEEDVAPVKFVVEGGSLFNSVVRLCVVHLQAGVRRLLKLEPESNARPDKAKNWKKVEKVLRVYMTELVALLARVNEESVRCVLLKHAHSMLPFYQAFQKGAKLLLNRLIIIWSRGGETSRILSFMCLVKLVRGNQPQLLEPAVKAMYLAYVKNSKFTSPSTISSISFMKRSLVEMMGLDHSLAYYQAFVYIRQLAIHLRNAITCSDKKESLLAVYNWQFIHSLELWAALVGHAGGTSEALQPLIYPLVQVVIGTAKLVPTPKYFPLRFHCARILSTISATTGTFIPVLPFYLEVLNTHNFGKKSKKASMKPLDFSCILKLSKSQMLESGFKDATIEEVYGGLLSYLADNSNKIAFPELVTPMVFQLKDFLKKCKVANYTKKIKQILDKTTANQKFIETRRKTVNFGVGDSQKIQVWESQVTRDGTPLLAHYRSWKKVSDLAQAKKVSEQEKMDDYAHIPMLKKNQKKLKMKMERSEVKEVTGFLSGSDEEDFDEEENFKLKEERGMKRKSDDDSDDEEEEAVAEKKTKASSGAKVPEPDSDVDEADDDDVEDLKLEDLESGSEEEMEDDYGLEDEQDGDTEDSENESDDD